MFWEIPSCSSRALAFDRGYDRGDKFTYYRSIPIFREYLLVAQHRPHVTHYVTQDEGKWSYEEFNEIEGQRTSGNGRLHSLARRRFSR